MNGITCIFTIDKPNNVMYNNRKGGEEMAVSEARRRANDKWDKEHTEKVQFKAPKGFNKMIEDRATELGMSKAGYMKYAIRQEIKSADNTKIVIKTHKEE